MSDCVCLMYLHLHRVPMWSSKLAFNLFSTFLAGDAVGYFSAPLKDISGFQDNLDGLNWIELCSDSPAVILIIFSCFMFT